MNKKKKEKKKKKKKKLGNIFIGSVASNYLLRVVGELFGAVAARNEKFRALGGFVMRQMFAVHFSGAFIVAVDGLHTAITHVTLCHRQKK